MHRARALAWILPIFVPLLLLAFDARPAAADTFTIPFPACPVSELVSAVSTANQNNRDDVIDLSGCTITLTVVDTSPGGDGLTGLPSVESDFNHTLTIQNGTIQRSSAGGTPSFRILRTKFGSSLTLQTLTINGGNVTTFGGGILSRGSLTLTDSTGRW